MEYNSSEINFIIYNNRSTDLVSKFFKPDINFHEFLDFEKKFRFLANLTKNEPIFDIDIGELNLEDDDIIYNIEDLNEQKDLILEASKIIKDYKEYQYLIDRGITDEIIEKYKIGSLSYIKDRKSLTILGITHHPLLTKLFEEGIEEGGILIPYFDNDDNLINCCCRRLYSLLTV